MYIFLIFVSFWLICGIGTAYYYIHETLNVEGVVTIGDIFTSLFIILLGAIGAFFTFKEHFKEHFNLSCDTIIWRKKTNGQKPTIKC